MLDLAATIAAADELLEGWRVLPPSPPADPLWRTLVRIRGGDARVDGAALSPFVVGAYGHSRGDSVVRGFGEAIERAALVPHPDRDHLIHARDGMSRLDTARPDVALSSTDAARAPVRWFRGRSLVDPDEVAVPAPLVDYPGVGIGIEHFDPSPSGTAAGIGIEAATRTAVLEVVERDAFLVAWDVGAPLRRIDFDDLPEPTSGRVSTSAVVLRRLVSTIAALGGTLVLAEIPTGVEGVLCAVAFLEDRDPDGHSRVAVGCNAHADPWTAVRGAVQESLQLRSLQVDLCTSRREVAAEDVRDDQSRLERLGSRAGAADVLAWMRGFRSARRRQYADVGTADLIAALVEDGGRPVAVDLTPRLPEPLQALGWAVVKVIPVGYQALRLDERHPWSWNVPRRRQVVDRWATTEGVDVVRPEGGGPPHPLP